MSGARGCTATRLHWGSSATAPMAQSARITMTRRIESNRRMAQMQYFSKGRAKLHGRRRSPLVLHANSSVSSGIQRAREVIDTSRSDNHITRLIICRVEIVVFSIRSDTARNTSGSRCQMTKLLYVADKTGIYSFIQDTTIDSSQSMVVGLLSITEPGFGKRQWQFGRHRRECS